MKRRCFFFFVIVVLIGLSGCMGQYVRWAEVTFNQGTNLEQYHGTVTPFLRTQRVYNQFRTVGIFDALWLAEPVRKAYVDLWVDKFGSSERDYDALLKQEFAKNDELISFYLLVEKEYVVRGLTPVGDHGETHWGVYLEIDDTVLHPVGIQKVDLAPEYRTLFGERLGDYKNMLKRPYLITFDAFGVPGQPFINEHTKSMKLVLSTTKKRVGLTWNHPAELQERK